MREIRARIRGLERKDPRRRPALEVVVLRDQFGHTLRCPRWSIDEPSAKVLTIEIGGIDLDKDI